MATLLFIDQIVGRVALGRYPPDDQFALVMDTPPPLFVRVKFEKIGIEETGAALLLVNPFVVVKVMATLVMLVYDKVTPPETL